MILKSNGKRNKIIKSIKLLESITVIILKSKLIILGEESALKKGILTDRDENRKTLLKNSGDAFKVRRLFFYAEG